MSVFGKSGLIGLQYLGVFLIAGIVQWAAGLPFWTLQVAAVLWFIFTVYRLVTVRCPHCGNNPFRGPLSYNPFAPTCRNCGESVFVRPAA